MALKFTELLNAIKAVASSRLGQISNQGMNWMLEQVNALRRASQETTADTRYTPAPEKIIDELSNAVKDDDLLKGVQKDHPLKQAGMFKTGDLILFQYDAKWKDKLPYWDRFPVVFPINFYKDGFLGINLHYLPPLERARLMDALYNLRNNQSMDETTILNISYEILKGASQYKAFRPCVKRYLYTHLTSHWLIIMPDSWEPVLFLPIARFQKANQQRVWDDFEKDKVMFKGAHKIYDTELEWMTRLNMWDYVLFYDWYNAIGVPVSWDEGLINWTGGYIDAIFDP